jgi:hypothetical protein
MADANYTMSANNGASDESRKAVIKATGALTAGRNLVIPAAASSVTKIYVVTNATSGGFAVTFKTFAGTGIAVPAGMTYLLRCDGTNVVMANIISLDNTSAVTGMLGVVNGGTGGVTAGAARTALGAAASGALGSSGITGAAASGANADITSLSAVTYVAAGVTLGSGGPVVGYRDVPQLSQTPATAMVLGDASKHYFASAAGTWTIPSSTGGGAVAYPIGTVLTFVNTTGSNCTIGITAPDTLTQAGTGSTGARTLANAGMATALKIGSAAWIISGSGLS